MKPHINITPLIDVLLVLLIIFMVISPLKPKRFEAMVPKEPDNIGIPDSLDSLVVQINKDSSLELNGNKEMGTIDDPSSLVEKLSEVFTERKKNGVLNPSRIDDPSIPPEGRIQKTVFIK
ncbi:MAG: biopolymer transporter ExbD, partial [Acidobacteria bacterium]|nr:biopolymer transporter ExbD [Acidobacteriota bacterium]